MSDDERLQAGAQRDRPCDKKKQRSRFGYLSAAQWATTIMRRISARLPGYLQIGSTARANDAWQPGHSSASAGTFSPQFEHMTFSGRLQNGQRSSAVSSTSPPQLGHGTDIGMPWMVSADSVLKQSSAATQEREPAFVPTWI